MKLAVFMSNSPASGWNMGMGLVATLKRMGHTVLSIPTPTEREAPKQIIELVKKQMPPVDVLKAQDAIIVSGPEHIGPWIDLCYGKYEWKNIGVPKAVWLHESCSREDYDIDFEAIKWCGDEWFFPAIQDAAFHDQEMFAKGRSHYLPFGVDTAIFKPHQAVANAIGEEPVKNFDVGFLGLLYPKRQVFLRALNQHKHPTVSIGMCVIQDLRGYDWEGSMRLLASNTRECKVFFNLPAMSRLLVAKVVETMACGTFLLTPLIGDGRGAEANMKEFESGKHLIYYSPSNLPFVAQLLREWVSPEKDAERARVAEAGCKLVHEKHNLRIRLAELLSKIAVKEPVQ